MRALLGLVLATWALPSVAAETLAFDSHLEPSDPLRIRLDLEAGRPVAYDWTSPEPVTFTIERPVESGRVVDVRTTQNRHEATFLPNATSAHVFSWEASGPKGVLVRVRLDGDFRYVDAEHVHQLPPAAYAPDVGFVLVVGVLALVGVRRR